MEQMVNVFGDMGLVETRPGVVGDPDFPETMMVAVFGPKIKPPPSPTAAGATMMSAHPKPSIETAGETLLARISRPAGNKRMSNSRSLFNILPSDFRQFFGLDIIPRQRRANHVW